MRLAPWVLVIVVLAWPRVAAADRAQQLEAWLRSAHAESAHADPDVIVLERDTSTLVCVRAHGGEPVCVREPDPNVRQVRVRADRYSSGTQDRYCFTWVGADGVTHEAQWERSAPGTHGPCQDTFVADDPGTPGLFSELTSERVPLFADARLRLERSDVDQVAVLLDGEAICLRPATRWVCEPRSVFFRALGAEELRATRRVVGADVFLVHAVHRVPDRLEHVLALVSFAGNRTRVLDRLALGFTVGVDTDPGLPLAWDLSGVELTLSAREPDARRFPRAETRLGRYRVSRGRFEPMP